MSRYSFSRGSVLLSIYLSIGVIALLGSIGMNMLQGPITTMAKVTKHTTAQNNMAAAGKLILVKSARDTGDCDNDGVIEPVEWRDAGGLPFPTNGGLLPATVGASLQDPWGTSYGYCAWDHGSQYNHPACVQNKRLKGDAVPSNLVIAIISAGPDKVFQSGCRPHGSGEYVLKATGADDIIVTYNFAEAMAASGGLWNLKDGDTGTATIAKNLSVTDSQGAEQLHFNAASKSLSIGSGGTGSMPTVKADYVQGMTDPSKITLLSNVEMGGNRVRGIGAPLLDSDAATRKYVDDKFASSSTTKKIKCEAFVFSGYSGGTTVALDKSSLGDCKKACEAAGAQCCSAQYKTLASNPNAELNSCTGHIDGKPSGTLVNLLAGLLFPAYIGAYCYEQY
ncbi:MAG: hypothetical protein DI626_02955 [Micavibrio aeruginosavorus]|uniref:Uncharacterized protein n=1 Tax=Micavibrio aeruginosavorus TaxID=349221 RepID=A0A2W5A646_9BACT|nr:MAG: hypothetical protein DI626_02955 [Micavibrio aeruginosavorus]